MSRLTKWMTALAMATGLALSGPSGLQAQSCEDVGGGQGDGCTITADASITIPQILYLDVTNTSVTFPNPQASDYTSSGDGTGTLAANSGASQVTHGGNVDHVVEIAATSGTFSGGKPASDLEWSLDGSTWNGLSTSAADVVPSTGGGAFDQVSVDYRLQLDLTTDAPGTQSLDFTYTIVAQ